MKNAAFAVALLAAVSAGPATAQMPDPQMTRMAAPAEPSAIPLYKGAAPGSESATYPEVWTKAFGREAWVRNITKPTLTPYLPKKGSGNGAAVLVIPGGGFQFVSISNEGWPVAQWLADHGVAAFVLKYRVQKTADGEGDFQKAMMARFQAPRADTPPDLGMQANIDLARADAQTALRMIRGNAAKWGVDAKRVGMLGFSAGAMTTMATTLANAPDARPDFIAPIYGFMLPVTPPPTPQPMFVALASDDPLFGKQGFGLVESWQKAGGSVELHFYEGGNHGFGAQKKGTTSDLWIDEYMAWMKARGFLKASTK
jgi:acetyl esterase/lipase